MLTRDRYEFWEHDQSGEIYAVRLNDRGDIDGFYGPLLSHQVRADRLAQFPYESDPKVVRWIENDRDDWIYPELVLPPRY